MAVLAVVDGGWPMKAAALLVAALAFGATAASASNDDSSTYLSVTLGDLEILSAGTVDVRLFSDGDLVATASRDVDEGASLRGLSAAVRAEGAMGDSHLGAEVLVDGLLAVAVGGTADAGSGALKFRVTQVEWPTESQVQPVGPELLSFRNGHSSDDIEVGFVPEQDIDVEGARVTMEAYGASGELLSRETVPAHQTRHGNLLASFHLDRLPPTVTWVSSLETSQGNASMWSTIDFPSGRSWDSGTEPGTPAIAMTFGKTHHVEDHSQTVVLPSTILTNEFQVGNETNVGEGFSGLEGRDPSALAADLMIKPQSEPPAEDSLDETPSRDSGADLGFLALKVVAVVAAGVLVLVLVLRMAGGGARR